MTFKLEIQCDNEAFGDEPAYEVLRILKRVIVDIQGTGELPPEKTLRDTNGNTVGSYGIKILS